MLTASEVISAVLRRFPAGPVVSTCGYTSRDLHHLDDQPRNLYLVGSMGMAAPVGLGIAITAPDQQVLVLDGDGSIAMNLSCLPMIASAGADLVHVVLDNGKHESTGGQRVAAPTDLVALAAAAGYPTTMAITTAEQLAAIDVARTPALVHIAIADRRDVSGRVRHTPEQIVTRFRRYLAVPSDLDA